MSSVNNREPGLLFPSIRKNEENTLPAKRKTVRFTKIDPESEEKQISPPQLLRVEGKGLTPKRVERQPKPQRIPPLPPIKLPSLKVAAPATSAAALPGKPTSLSPLKSAPSAASTTPYIHPRLANRYPADGYAPLSPPASEREPDDSSSYVPLPSLPDRYPADGYAPLSPPASERELDDSSSYVPLPSLPDRYPADGYAPLSPPAHEREPDDSSSYAPLPSLPDRYPADGYAPLSPPAREREPDDDCPPVPPCSPNIPSVNPGLALKYPTLSPSESESDWSSSWSDSEDDLPPPPPKSPIVSYPRMDPEESAARFRYLYERGNSHS